MNSPFSLFRWSSCASIPLLSLLLLPLVSAAQNPRGTLRGIVLDVSGAAIPAAKIVVHAQESNFQREATATDKGEFRLEDLAPGAYEVVVSENGFADARSSVRVTIGSVQELSVVLKIASALQTIKLEENIPSITAESMDIATAVQQATIYSQDLDTIPLPARSFANIAYMAPGTQPVEPSDPTKARITAVATGGSSGLNNEVSVDGVDNSDNWIGGFLQNFSPEAIEAFTIRTAQEDAERAVPRLVP